MNRMNNNLFRDIKEIMKITREKHIDKDALIIEAETVEEYSEYSHMSLMGYDEDQLRAAADLMYLYDGYIPAENENVQILEQYTNGNYTDMIPGTIVLDYALNIYWEVISNNGKSVALKEARHNNGVTMNVSDKTCSDTFVLLANAD